MEFLRIHPPCSAATRLHPPSRTTRPLCLRVVWSLERLHRVIRPFVVLRARYMHTHQPQRSLFHSSIPTEPLHASPFAPIYARTRYLLPSLVSAALELVDEQPRRRGLQQACAGYWYIVPVNARYPAYAVSSQLTSWWRTQKYTAFFFRVSFCVVLRPRSRQRACRLRLHNDSAFEGFWCGSLVACSLARSLGGHPPVPLENGRRWGGVVFCSPLSYPFPVHVLQCDLAAARTLALLLPLDRKARSTIVTLCPRSGIAVALQWHSLVP